MCEDARKTFESTECVISRLPAAPATRPHSYHASRVAPGSRGDFGLSFFGVSGCSQVLPAALRCSWLLSLGASPACSWPLAPAPDPNCSRLLPLPAAPGDSRLLPIAPGRPAPGSWLLQAVLVSGWFPGWCPVGVWVRCSRIPAAPATVPHLTARADRACREQARPLPAAPNRSWLLPPPTPHLSRASAAAAGCSRRPLTLDGPG